MYLNASVIIYIIIKMSRLCEHSYLKKNKNKLLCILFPATNIHMCAE